MDQTFLQVVVLINCESDGNRADVIPCHFVFFDEGFVGAATMFGGCGRWEMPFYVGCSADEGHVIKIDYLGTLLTSEFRRQGEEGQL